MKKKIIITGATGFIGKHVLEILDRNKFKIHILSRNEIDNTNKSHKEDKYHKLDLKNLEQVEQIVQNIQATHLIHLAWDVKQADFSGSWQNINWITYTINLANAFIKNGGKHLIGAGTCFEYDWTNKQILQETSPCNPATLYGVCKLETSKILQQMCKSAGVKITWGRIFYPYGEGEEPRKLFSAVIEALKNNKTFICKTPNNVIDYIHVKDIANTFEKILEDKVEGIVNICSGEQITVRERLEIIGKHIHKQDLLTFEDNKNENIVLGSIKQLDETVKSKRKRKLFKHGIQELIEHNKQMNKGLL